MGATHLPKKLFQMFFLFNSIPSLTIVNEKAKAIIIFTPISPFKIESTFREMKQVIGALGYRFWGASMPKLNWYLRRDEVHPVDQVENEADRRRIRATLEAMERFVICSCIATGLVQLLSLHFSSRVPALFFRYLRTPSKSIVSETTVTAYLRKSIFRLFAQNPQLPLTKLFVPSRLRLILTPICWFLKHENFSLASLLQLQSFNQIVYFYVMPTRFGSQIFNVYPLSF